MAKMKKEEGEKERWIRYTFTGAITSIKSIKIFGLIITTDKWLNKDGVTITFKEGTKAKAITLDENMKEITNGKGRKD